VLEKAGYDAHKIGEILTARYEEAAKANARQEDLKRQLKEATAEVEALTDALYRSASGYLDAAMSAVGKGSDAAKNFQRLRSRVRMPGDQVAGSGEAPTVEQVLEGRSRPRQRLPITAPHRGLSLFFDSGCVLLISVPPIWQRGGLMVDIHDRPGARRGNRRWQGFDHGWAGP